MAKITLAPYDSQWEADFLEVGSALRAALEPVLGDRLTGVHHIGSTSVPGIAAKPIIDVQVSVRDFRPWTRTDLVAPDEPAERPSREHIGESEALIDAVESTGLRWLGDWCIDYRKWLFNRRDDLAVNCHVRREGCVSQQQALLFRDYLRVNKAARQRYEDVKRELAARDWDLVDDYADAKGDCVWGILREADKWSQAGWFPSSTDI
ncbi:GrpB family protein [Actinomadura miaoliensis]|uniref:GrpB family protein n=1 Tax=Actinomadura miaoliensis TaxID=430685 RepID=A0ABP7UVG9_9ACTN